MTVQFVSFLYFFLSQSRLEPEALRSWGWESLEEKVPEMCCAMGNTLWRGGGAEHIYIPREVPRPRSHPEREAFSVLCKASLRDVGTSVCCHSASGCSGAGVQTWKDSRPSLLIRLLYGCQGRRECSITSLLLSLFFHMTKSWLPSEAPGWWRKLG